MENKENVERLCFTVLGDEIHISLALFRNVKNIKDLQTKGKFGLAFCFKHVAAFFLDGEMVFDVEHITHGVCRAFYNIKRKTRKTKNLVFEIVYFLSAYDQVKDCISQLELKCDSSTTVFVGINLEEADLDNMIKQVDGELVKIQELPYYHNKKKILQNYKCVDENILKKYIWFNAAAKSLF